MWVTAVSITTDTVEEFLFGLRPGISSVAGGPFVVNQLGSCRVSLACVLNLGV